MPAPFILDSVAGAVAAWSSGRQLMAGFVQPPMDTAAGACTTIRDQVGARDASAGGSPAIGSGDINGNAYVKLDGANDKLSFSSLALGSGDWTMFLAVGFTGAAAGPLIARSSSSAVINHSSATGFTVQSDSAGPVSYATSWAIPNGFHILRIERDASAGNITIFQNGEAVGNGLPRSISGSFTFDQLGVLAAGSAWSNAGFGECIVFGRILSPSEVTSVESDMGTAWRSAIYVDSAAGDDTNLGWEPGSALQNISAIRTLHLRRGSSVLLKSGSVWRRDPLLFNKSFQVGTVDAPITIDQYGSGDKPKLIGSTEVAGPYINVSGNEFKKVVALTNIQCVWAYDGTGAITRLVAGTSGALGSGQWAYAAGELHFNIGGNPAAYKFECAQQDPPTLADIDGCRPARPFMNVSNIHLIHWPEDGFKFEGANCSARGLISEWNANDGIGGAATGLYLGQSLSQNNGKGRATSGSAGDGVSLHGGSSIVIEDVICRYNDKAGIDHQETVNATMRNCWMEGNNQNILTASLVGVPGTQIWENCVVVRRPGDHSRACQFVRSTAHIVRHLTIVNLDVASNFLAIYVSSTGAVTIQNTVTDGFATGVFLNAGTLVHDHNLHNNTAAYSGTVAGAGDATGNPLFTDGANVNFMPLSGSLSLGTGLNLGVTIDYLHNPRPVGLLPDKGAFERQSVVSLPPSILDSVTGAVAAWSSARQLVSAFVQPPMDTSGGACTIIRDQVGARDASASGSPPIGSGNINGNAYIKLDGASDKLTFPSLALGNGDWTIFLAVGFTGAAADSLIGRSSSSAVIRHSSTTGFTVQSDSAGPLSYGTSWAIPNGFHILRIERDASAGNITIFQNGEAVGNGLPQSISGNFTFDQFGVSGAGSAWSNAGFGECIVFGRILSPSEVTSVESDMSPEWRSAIYVDSAAGNDGNTGWEPGSALKNISAIRPLHLRRGSSVLLKCNSVWRRDPLLFNKSFQTGIANAPITIDQYGSGNKPKFIGSVQVTGPYSNVSGDEYKKVVALTNIQCVWAYDNTGAITRLVAGTSGSLVSGQWAYASGELHVNIGGDPASYKFECAQQDPPTLADIDGCRPARPFMNISNIHLIHWPEDGFKFEGANCSARGLVAEWNANDGIGGAAINVYLGQSLTQHNGKARANSGSSGDGVSLHGGTSIVIEDVIALYNDKAGIDHQETVNATMRNCWMEGNNQNILTSVLVGAAGTQIWENCIVVRRPGDHAFACQFTRSTTHIVRHLTIVNIDVVSNFRAIFVSSTGNVTVQNTVTDGFAIGIMLAAGTLVHDHNLHNNTAAYSGTVAGAGDATGNPLFTDRTNCNFLSLSGSLLLSTGANLGVIIDFLHNPRPFGLLPDKGAMERQSL